MSKKIKICYVIDSLAAGGKERQLILLLQSLSKLKKYKILLVLIKDAIHYKQIYDIDVELKILKQTNNKFVRFKQMFSILRKFNPDFIQTWEKTSTYYCIPYSFMFRKKLIGSFLRSAIDIKKYSKNDISTKLISLFCYKIVANSKAGLVAANFVNNYKNITIYNGFNFDRVKNTAVKPNDLSLNSKTKIVGMVANINKNKDHKSVLGAAYKLIDEGYNVYFVFIGEGKNKSNYIQGMPAKYKKCINFLGRKENIEDYVNVFDIGILISYIEGMSNSIMEYMAFKKPVVATNCGGTPELIEDKKTGFLVKLSSSTDIYKKIKYLLDNPVKAKQIGEAGFERLKAKFSVDAFVKSWEKIYK